jgi:hypothetical protein
MAEPTTATAVPEKGAKPAKGKRVRAAKKEKKNVPHAIATVQASFNNTVIAIADQEGGRPRLVVRRTDRIQGLPEGDAVRGPARRGQLRREGQGARRAFCGRARQRARGGTRERDSRPAGQRPRHQVDQRHDPDSAQRMSSEKAAAGMRKPAAGDLAVPRAPLGCGRGSGEGSRSHPPPRPGRARTDRP